MFVLLLVPSCQWVGETFFTDRTPCDYYFPEGFTGWAEIRFAVAGAPAVPRENGRSVFKLPKTGLLETSTKFEEGSARDRYFYYSPGSTREIKETDWGGGGMIWAPSVGGEAVNTPLRERFFVGTERQYYRAVGDPRGNQ
jgi:hypothetical protein